MAEHYMVDLAEIERQLRLPDSLRTEVATDRREPDPGHDTPEPKNYILKPSGRELADAT